MSRRSLLPTLAALLLIIGCAEEEPELTASLHAKCKGCVVSYAGGVMQSKKDTLYGMVDPDTGDTLPEEGHWTVRLKDGDNLFLRACHLDSLAVGADIDLWVDGDVRTIHSGAPDDQECVEINQPVRGL